MSYKRHKTIESLERVKRWPNLINRFSKVRIYSAEHGYYWRGAGQGYTSNPQESDIWDFEEAYKRTRHCGPEKAIRYIEASHD